MVIVREIQGQPGIRWSVGPADHADEAVLGVPGVIPAAILGEVAVGVVDKGFGRLDHHRVADAGGHDVGVGALLKDG